MKNAVVYSIFLFLLITQVLAISTLFLYTALLSEVAENRKTNPMVSSYKLKLLGY